jgi:serine/threonine protein kinase
MLGAKVAGTEPIEVTPENYWVKIIDFGMAREWREGDMTNQVGTLFYRAPELLLGERRYGSKVDIWSLGCVFYFMQTGALLFKGSSEMEQLRSIVAVLGAEIGGVANGRLREGLVIMKMEGVQ